MRQRTDPTSLAVSLFATPSPLHAELFYTVVRAGHLIGGPDHYIQRDHYPGHEIILCLRGRGFTTVGSRRHQVRAKQLVWTNCHRPHEHGAIASDPWELFWIRIEGPRLDRMAEVLNVVEAPVFVGFDFTLAVALYREIFALLQEQRAEAPALVHAALARLIALVFTCRQGQSPAEPQSPLVLQRAIEQMKLFYFKKQRVAELAALCGMSESHFTRLFRAAFGTTPIDWLRRERINQAKRRLAETTDAIKEIAAQVGYGDHYFFSKDFKHFTGMPPREYRRRETARSDGGEWREKHQTCIAPVLFYSRDPEFMPTPHDIFAQLSPAVAEQLFTYLIEREKPLYKATIETLAKQRKLRAIFVERKPRPERHLWLKEALGRKVNESVAAHLLQIWLVGAHAKLLCDFLDGLGIAHDENGTIETLPPAPAKEELKKSIDALFTQHDPGVVAVYLHAFQALDDHGWPTLAELLVEDPRLQLTAPAAA